MKKIAFLLLCWMWSTNESSGQAISTASEDAVELQNFPKEEVFIHRNNPLLFSGEYLYYKLYSYNPSNLKLSKLSKVGYVELIDRDKQPVFRHKVHLENGTGSGDFFVPTTLPSGNYKLVGYTSWMTNEKRKPFYTEDVVIINPYRGNQQKYISPENGKINDDSLSTQNSTFQPEPQEYTSKNLALNTDADTYQKRSPVTLTLSSQINEKAFGNYSISVRRKDPLENMFSGIFSSEKGIYDEENTFSGSSDSIYLPELRGEILSGRIEANNGQDDNLEGRKISVSIPGENYLVKVAGTDAGGNFLFNLDKRFTGQTALLEVLGENEKIFNIFIDPKPGIDYSKLNFQKIPLVPNAEEMILERSVYNQIENGYYNVKPDTVLQKEAVKPFFGNHIETYDLDEYTRFNTMKETFIEIVKFAKIITNSQGENEFRIRGNRSAELYDTPPLLVVDGAILQDQDAIINFGAKKVKSIGIIRDRYYYGPEIFNGVVHIETVEGDFLPQLNNNSVLKKELLPYQPEKAYFQQNYGLGASEKERIPDYRTQLLWEPQLLFDSEKKTIQFYTSDVTGNFEISLEGFTHAGKPVSIKRTFSVE